MSEGSPAPCCEGLAQAARAAGLRPGALVLPSDRHVALNGIRLHYLDWGNAHLPTVVLLHGGGLTAHSWDLCALLLRDRYHLIALDQRGHGDSEWTPAAQSARDPAALMLEDTCAFLEFLDCDGAALVGASLGGLSALRCAALERPGLDAVAVVDVAPDTLAACPRGLAAFQRATADLEAFEEFVASARRCLPERPEAQLRYSLSHALARSADGRWRFKFDPALSPLLAPDAEQGARGSAALWDAVRAIRVPALVLRGAQSEPADQEIAERMVKEMSDARLAVIPRARHSVHADNPADFARALDRFLSDVLPEADGA